MVRTGVLESRPGMAAQLTTVTVRGFRRLRRRRPERCAAG